MSDALPSAGYDRAVIAALHAKWDGLPGRLAPHIALSDVRAVLKEVDVAEKMRVRAAVAELQRDHANMRHDECHHAFAKAKADVEDLRSRLACVLEASYADRPYDERLAAIRGMCDLTTDGMTPAVLSFVNAVIAPGSGAS